MKIKNYLILNLKKLEKLFNIKILDYNKYK